MGRPGENATPARWHAFLAFACCFHANDTQKIKVEAFVETLCNDCHHWMLEELRPVWLDEALRDKIDLHVYAFGNANYVGSDVTCQHGQKECDGNTAIDCAIKHFAANSSAQFAFCMFENIKAVQVKDDMLRAVKSCGESSAPREAIEPLLRCLYGTEGRLETAVAAKATMATGNRYTPWILVNGVHSHSAELDFRHALCVELPDASRPASCRETSLIRREAAPHGHFGCPNPWSEDQRKLGRDQEVVEVSSAGVRRHGVYGVKV